LHLKKAADDLAISDSAKGHHPPHRMMAFLVSEVPELRVQK
jgi:hypothetical protein